MDSETESERYEDSCAEDDDDDSNNERRIEPPPTAASVPTPWNNVLALTAPLVDSVAIYPTPGEPSVFVSPFAALQPIEQAPQSVTCPRCLKSLDATAVSDGVNGDIVFCVCCKRLAPLRSLTGDALYTKRCILCAETAIDALVAQLPSHVRIADDRADDAKLQLQNDTRIRDLDAQEAVCRTALEVHVLQRRAVFQDRRTTLEDTKRLVNDWLALEKQCVSLRLQRIVVLDAFLASHFLPSLLAVSTFLQSLGLAPAEAFPMEIEYDTSEQCDECDVLLSSPPPHVGKKPIVVGFCDCCKRLLPGQDVGRSRPDARRSFCEYCQRRRGFSLMSEANLVPLPAPSWCRTLAESVEEVGRRFKRTLFICGEAIVGRLAEAKKGIATYKDRAVGLRYRQLAVLRQGNTPMDVSRHWYAEQATTYRGLEAALLKQVLLYTEAGATAGMMTWKPVVKLVQPPLGYPENDLPEWLTTFVNDRWPKLTEKAPEVSPTKTPTKPSEPVRPPVAEIGPTNTPPVSQDSSKQVSDTDDSQITEKKPAKALQPVGPTHICGRCGAGVPLTASGKGQPSFCDCCELVLHASRTKKLSLDPRVSLCVACFEHHSTKSPDEIKKLIKRPDYERMNLLGSYAGSFRSMLEKASTTGPVWSNCPPNKPSNAGKQRVETSARARCRNWRPKK